MKCKNCYHYETECSIDEGLDIYCGWDGHQVEENDSCSNDHYIKNPNIKENK